MTSKLPDTQGKNINGAKINKVGIRETYGEVIFKNKIIPANFSLYVSLISGKGIHMSRLPEALIEHCPLAINKHSIHNVLDVMEQRSGDFCEDYFIKTGFEYAREGVSPVRKIKSFMLIPIKIKSEKINGKYRDTLEVIVPYTSLCPCSKEISKHSAHNQRSFATVTVRVKEGDFEELSNTIIGVVEACASCPIYNILKREDEKYVTEKAYENPKFVEDVSRGISASLDVLLDNEIDDYSVVINHEESIHQHQAVAFMNCGRRLK